MALFDRFRRRDIRDTAAVAAFIDDQSFAFALAVVQSYCRMRAGARADALFAVPAFSAALEKACWEAYPRGLAMIATMVGALLRPVAGENWHATLFGLVALVLEQFDRRAVPPAIGKVDWRAARAQLERSLTDLARARPQSAETVIQDHASFYLAIMPLHPELGPDDFPSLCRDLKTSLIEVQEMFAQRAHLAALAAELAARVPRIEAGEAPSAPV